ncbi:MAG: TonB-dependent receptor, partial [Woeseiaceae bacterium]
VFGLERREQVYEVDADVVFAEGLLLGQGGATPSVTGEYDVNELFLEARVPILEGNQDLALDLGYRYSDYSTFGGESTYKVGFEYAPVDFLRVRAGFNRAVRVPNVDELFQPQTNGLFGGNPNLKPEEADTITFGVVVQPMDNLQFSIDYWSIDIEGIIGTVGGELIVEQCALTGSAVFCDQVQRSATGSLWLGTTGKVNDVNINQGSREWEGIDLAASYDVDVFGGNLALTLTGTKMETKTYKPIQGDSSADYDCVGLLNTDCFATPDWRSVVSATYDQGTAWSTNLRWRTMGEVSYDGTADTIADGNLDTQHYIDLSLGYELNDNMAFILGINNIVDEEPPLVGGTLQSNGNAPNGNYDILGRQIFLNVELTY